MSSISQHNNKQDQRITALEQIVKNLVVKLDKFIENDFYHFKRNAFKFILAIITFLGTIIGLLIKIILS